MTTIIKKLKGINISNCVRLIVKHQTWDSCNQKWEDSSQYTAEREEMARDQDIDIKHLRVVTNLHRIIIEEEGK